MVAIKPFAAGLVLLASLLSSAVSAHDVKLALRTDHRAPFAARRDEYAGGGYEAYPAAAYPAEGGHEPAHAESAAPAYEAAAPAETWAAPAEAWSAPAESWAAPEYTAAPGGEAYPPPADHSVAAPADHSASPAPEPTYPPAEAPPAYPTYGSGAEPPAGGLEGCLATCSASFGLGAPHATATAPPAPGATGAPPAKEGGDGGGAKTHTVIVAPSQGVLKFVPFTVKANPGDTIRYKWGAGPHTATKSSLLGICNATTVEPFTSGRLNKSAEFDQVVGSADPTFVFCGVQPHCTKGMFSIVNPPTAPANVTAGSEAANAFDPWLASVAANSTAVQTMIDQAKGVVGNNSAAWAWGGKMAMDSNMEEWAKMAAIENTLWTRMSFATNPSALVDGFSLASFNAPPSFADLANGTSAHTGGEGGAHEGPHTESAGGAGAPSTPSSAASASSASAGSSSTSGASTSTTAAHALTLVLASAPLLALLSL